MFKLGDVVRLKRGSKAWMTVEKLSRREEVGCVWFVGTRLNRDTFQSDQLQLA